MARNDKLNIRRFQVKKIYSIKAWATVRIVAIFLIALAVSFTGYHIVKAEQSGSTPESGVVSRIKTLYTDLQGLTFGADTDTPDWGTYWNRIKTAAKWTPSTTAGASDVSSTKTFTPNGSRTATSGTFNLSNLTAATVKNGTLFGVGLTGDYPSATNLLPGAGTVATAGDVKTGKVAWSNTGTQISGTYSPVAAGPCATQQYYDGYGAPVTETTNCSSTWTVSPSPVTGDDSLAGRGGLDPKTGLVWSQYLKNNAGTIQFVTSGGTSWNWNGQLRFTVTAANATAGATYTNNGQTFTVVTTIAGTTTLTTTPTGSPAASGTLTKATGTGDATITFSSANSTDAPNAAVGGKTASQLCTSQGNGWGLPTEKELMQAYIDGAFFNLTQPSNAFWSATEYSSTLAYGVSLNDGATSSNNKTLGYYVRCVR
jgi:hypothetical protein